MGAVEQRFFSSLMHGIAAPIEEVNSKACFAWRAAEGGTARWNPFNTTQHARGATDYNGAGAKNYPNEETNAVTARNLSASGLWFARLPD
jgi:hypothetical protein